jgi:hypothetical protein
MHSYFFFIPAQPFLVIFLVIISLGRQGWPQDCQYGDYLLSVVTWPTAPRKKTLNPA